MNLRDFLLSVLGITLLCWTAFVTVLLYVNPELTSVLGFAVFYGALFLSLIGTFSLVGIGVRTLMKRLHHKRIVAMRFVIPSVRQAAWFALAVCISLVLLAAELFNWWSIGLLLLGLTIFESFFLLQPKNPKVQVNQKSTEEL